MEAEEEVKNAGIKLEDRETMKDEDRLDSASSSGQEQGVILKCNDTTCEEPQSQTIGETRIEKVDENYQSFGESKVASQVKETNDEEPNDETESAIDQKNKSSDDEKLPSPNLAQRLDDKSNECILEPLEFPNTPPKNDKEAIKPEKFHFDEEYEGQFPSDETPCIFCDNLYKNISEKAQNDEYLCHLIVEHKLVIADVKLVADLRKYVIYWKKRMSEKPLEDICTVITTNTGPKDVQESEKYFLLCDELVEDRKIREELQMIRLKELIEIQTAERNSEEFERMCLFCTKFFIGDRYALFNHLNEDHNFNVGHPHNLIYADDFLDELEKKLNSLECLFCDRVFKDRASLREHMRKKSHRRLNPKNKHYDKYYIINYLELGKNWEVLQTEPDHFESPEDWSGWDAGHGQTAVCFYCSASFGTQDRVFEHMKDTHGFDFVQMRKDMHLSFYQQVKMVNYIRRTVHQLSSTKNKADEDTSEDKTDPANGFATAIKECISTSTKWNQPQYYFPTYENDTLLCQLEDKEGLFEPEDTFVIGEDGIDCKAIINESVLTDLVVQGYFE